jgi:hypothetical protein
MTPIKSSRPVERQQELHIKLLEGLLFGSRSLVQPGIRVVEIDHRRTARGEQVLDAARFRL